MNRIEAIKLAKTFSNDLEGLSGQIPLERVVKKHIEYFKYLRAEGVTWSQIANLMNDVGVSRRNGTSVSPEQWRAMVSRITLKNKNTDMPSNKQSDTRNITNAHQSIATFKDLPIKPTHGDQDSIAIRERMRAAKRIRGKT